MFIGAPRQLRPQQHCSMYNYHTIVTISMKSSQKIIPISSSSTTTLYNCYSRASQVKTTLSCYTGEKYIKIHQLQYNNILTRPMTKAKPLNPVWQIRHNTSIKITGINITNIMARSFYTQPNAKWWTKRENNCSVSNSYGTLCKGLPNTKSGPNHNIHTEKKKLSNHWKTGPNKSGIVVNVEKTTKWK